MRNSKVESILDRLDEFLQQKIVPEDTGWTAVDKKDLVELGQLIREIISSKWAPDVDGDYSVEFALVDRNVGRLPYFQYIPYPSKDLEGAFNACLSNLEVATDEMSRLLKGLQLEGESLRKKIADIEEMRKKYNG